MTWRNGSIRSYVPLAPRGTHPPPIMHPAAPTSPAGNRSTPTDPDPCATMATMYRLKIDHPLTLDELETVAREHGVTFPPCSPLPDETRPSGWRVADWDAGEWIEREWSANLVFGPRARATRRQRIGRP